MDVNIQNTDIQNNSISDIHDNEDIHEESFSGATLELNISSNEDTVNDDSKSEFKDNSNSLNKNDNSAVLKPIDDSASDSFTDATVVDLTEAGAADISEGSGAAVGYDEEVPHPSSPLPALRRNRPFSASMASRGSTLTRSSVTSRTTLSSQIFVNDRSCSRFFSHRDGTFDLHCTEAMDDIIKPDIDGKVLGSWLLVEIDHWDKENERIFITTERSLLVITYDFIRKLVLSVKRVNLRRIDQIRVGDLVYVKGSVNTPRQYGAVRLSWESTTDAPSFGQRWNPFCTSIPFVFQPDGNRYIVIANHPMIYNQKECESLIYNVDDFIEITVAAIKDSYKVTAKFTLFREEGDKLECADELLELEEPIEINSYAGLLSTIYNQSMLGFNRDRNGLNF